MSNHILEIELSEQAKEDIYYWSKISNKMKKRIELLINSIKQNGLDSQIGKPEPLKYQYSGFFSARINKKHRLIYGIQGKKLFIVSCKGHYN